MTAIAQKHRPTQFIPSHRYRRTVQSRQRPDLRGPASLKAGLAGAGGLVLLLFISLVPFEFLACLVIPGFAVAALSTGLLAGVLAGESVQNSHQGGEVGWTAGFVAGIGAGLVAMVLASFGVFMPDFGQGVLAQFSPDQLTWLLEYGFSPSLIALSGRVIGAMVTYGIIGSLVSALFSSIGGMMYPHL